MRHLVVGSTGMVGGQVCRRLLADGQQVRAFVRETSSSERIDALRAAGAEVVVGDLRSPETLDAACGGVATVVCTVSAMPHSYIPGINDMRTTDLLGVLDLISAAARAGVQRIVYTSFSRGLDAPCPLERAKRTIEARLRGGLLDYTILRPSCFMESWLSPAFGFDPAAATATIYGDGSAPISWIAAADVAEFAARAAVLPAVGNTVLELGGPEAISPLDVVAIFERVGGRPFTLSWVPLAALEARRAAATDPMEQSVAALMCSYAHGDAIPMGPALAAIPIRLTSVEAYAARVCLPGPVSVA